LIFPILCAFFKIYILILAQSIPFFKYFMRFSKIPITKAAVNHKKLIFTAAFETLKFLYFRKLGVKVG